MVNRVRSQVFSLLIMSISIMQWRVEIRMFNPTHHKTRFINDMLLRVLRLSSAFRFGTRLVFVVLMLFACGDIELNPGPKRKNSCYNFSVWYWNLKSITVHNFVKIDLLQAYNTIHQYDMICSKSVSADHLGNATRGGVCILRNPYLWEFP